MTEPATIIVPLHRLDSIGSRATRNRPRASGVLPEMRRSILTAAATVVLCTACGGSAKPRSATSAAAADPSACRPAPIHHGPPPAWTAAAWTDSTPGFTVPYALASGNAAGAFFFAHPIRAGRPSNPSNKVLWIVRFPRDGNPLDITARYGADRSLVVRTSWPADSDPGEIYPSELDLSRPGCWTLTLAWGRHRASIDVHVSATGR